MANKETLRKSLTIKLSTPSKMPGFTFDLPAGRACPTGSKLCKVPGSVCEGCYGQSGCNMFPDAKRVRAHNLAIVRQGDTWASELITFLQATKQAEFRIHSTGDIQSLSHLESIVKVAQACPNTRFWLPTKEYRTIREYLKTNGSFPINLCVRVSAPMLAKPISNSAACGLPTSTVNCDIGFNCPVKNSKAKCDTYNCRACWDNSVKNINYHVHGMRAKVAAKRNLSLKVIQ